MSEGSLFLQRIAVVIAGIGVVVGLLGVIVGAAHLSKQSSQVQIQPAKSPN